MLQPDRKAHIARRHPRSALLGLAQLLMGGRRGMDRQRARIADIRNMVEEFQRVDKGTTRLDTAGQLEPDQRAEAALKKGVSAPTRLTALLAGENRLHNLRVLRQIPGHFHRVFIVLTDAQRQRLQPLEEEEGVLRRDRGTDIAQQLDPRPQHIGDGAQRFRGLGPDGAVIGIIGPGQQRKAVGMGLPVEIAAIDNGAADRGPMRLLSVAFIEVMRAIPMVAILYFAMLILPMALPAGVILDKLTRATIMIALFWTAYLAEVVRGGLQTIGAGQSEAAQSLGLGYWQAVRLVVLPQALRRVIPGLVNLGIGFLLATSLLAVIGAFDLLNTAKASTTDQQWLGFYDEAYIFAAAIYFLLCFAGSRYSLWLEERLRRG